MRIQISLPAYNGHGYLFYIAVAYYGDYLIIYYKLEEKYPKLAKLIKLIIKF